MQTVIYLSTFSLAVPFLTILFTKSLKYAHLRLFIIYIFAGAITEVIIRIFVELHLNTWVVSHIWFPLEFGLLAFFLLKSVRKKTVLFEIFIVLLLAGNLYMHLVVEFDQPIATYGLLLSASSLIVLSLYVLFRLTFRDPSMNLFQDYRFYITMGIFIYQAGIISLTIYFTFYILPLWLHAISNIAANILFSYAIYLHYKKEKFVECLRN